MSTNPLRVIKAFKKIESYSFSSVQVDFPRDISDEIIAWGRKHIPENILYSEPGDPSFFTGRETEIHVTVLYGLHINDHTLVQALLKDIKPFEITLGNVSIFEKDECDVVKIDMESPELKALNKLIKENFEVTNSFPNYIPHCTVAYVKKGEGQKYIGMDAFAGKKVKVESVCFSGRDNRKVTLNLRTAKLERPNRLRKFPPVIAVDFDETIVHKTEDVMDPNFKLRENAKEVLDWMHAKGFYIIIWTVRDGECQKVALDFLKKTGIYFDMINDNAPFLNFPTSRKIYFDYVIDDRGNKNPIDWLAEKDFIQKTFLEN